MTAAKLIAAAEELGVKLHGGADGRLVASPKGRLPPVLKAELSAHKAAVLDLIERQAAARAAAVEVALEAPPACADCGGTSHTVSLVYSDGSRSCAACITGVTQMRARGTPL